MSAERDFITKFESLDLPLTDFNHIAHVRLAWCYLKNYPLPETMMRFRDALKRFAAHHGKSELYHETITFAFIFLIHDRLHTAPCAEEDWMQFAQRNPDLLYNGKALLLKLYREETLSSPQAKKTYQLPVYASVSAAEKILDRI